MEPIFSLMTPLMLMAALGLAVIAGVVKGMVGFALPMILISGLSSFLPPDVALAGLLLPTVATNVKQAFRQGPRAVVSSVKKFRVFLIAGLVTLIFSAQLVRVLPSNVMLLAIGLMVSVFTLIQLFGFRMHLGAPSAKLEASVGGFAGLIGGMSGIWGPPTVLYLTALGTEKSEQVRVQGVIYGLGALALVGAHFGSGILKAQTLPFSMALVPPALLGMWFGEFIQDRIDQATFRKATLIFLSFAALNLVRRALMG